MCSSVDDVRTILASGDFQRLKGLVENDELEFKGEPYRLEQGDQQKQELAKDVTALANANGGLIVLGAKTRRMSDSARDKIVEVRPFSASRVDVGQYRDVLASWIVPEIGGLEIEWYPSGAEEDNGVVAISLPQQAKERWPFLVVRHVSDAGKRSEVVFGYFERKQDRVDHLTVEQLRSYLNTGFRHETLLREEFGRLGELIRERTSPAQPRAVVPSLDWEQKLRQWDERVSAAVDELGLSELPTFVLSAIPDNPVEVPSLFEGRDSELFKLLENPPELRSSGFDLDTGSRPTIVRGELRRALTPDWKILELWDDGTLVFVSRGDENGLCWASQNYRPLYFRINPLYLVEQTYLFQLLSRRLLGDHFLPPAPSATYRLEIRNAVVDDEYRLQLPRDARERYPDARPAPGNTGLFTQHVGAEALSAGRSAFLLVKQVYNWFGYEDDVVPYIALDDSERAISEARIVAAGQAG